MKTPILTAFLATLAAGCGTDLGHIDLEFTGEHPVMSTKPIHASINGVETVVLGGDDIRRGIVARDDDSDDRYASITLHNCEMKAGNTCVFVPPTASGNDRHGLVVTYTKNGGRAWTRALTGELKIVALEGGFAEFEIPETMLHEEKTSADDPVLVVKGHGRFRVE